MQQLTILSGAGVNMAIASECPSASELINFSYHKVSEGVYEIIGDDIRRMVSPESFDYILGGLMTINLAIEKTKQDLIRFNIDQAAFSALFRQSEFQETIVNALNTIEERLTLSLSQMLSVVQHYSSVIDEIQKKYSSINYFTLNFDGIFDHIIYGENYKRGKSTTDFWKSTGLVKSSSAPFKIYHLHGRARLNYSYC